MEESSRLSKDVVDAFSNAIQLIEETLEALHTASSTSDAKDAAKVRETLLSKEQQLLDRFYQLISIQFNSNLIQSNLIQSNSI